MGLEATIKIGKQAQAAPEPAVLELRVHGVNNTSAPALLDLRPGDVELVAGDKLGSFWRPTAEARARRGKRGAVPDGIVREAYSWGGMVRTTPDAGRAGFFGILLGGLARVFYALILPFSLANVAQWTWALRPAAATERGTRLRAGATRMFGILLTLLFTTTAATVALDLGAAQCAADASLCGQWSGFFALFADWTAGRRLALFALVPVLAVLTLWLISAIARLRYDVLPGIGTQQEAAADAAAAAAGAPSESTRRRRARRVGGDAISAVEPPPAVPALLAERAFWANRISADLARVHLAAAVLLVTTLVSGHAAMRWYTQCAGLRIDAQCLGDGVDNPGFAGFLTIALVALVALLACIALVFWLPTTAVKAGRRGTGEVLSGIALGLAVAVFVVAEIGLLTAADGDVEPVRLYGSGATPLVLITAALLIALSGVAWRPFRDRRYTAWAGCGPAVFLLLALTVAVATSAIVVVTAGNLLGSDSAADLVRDPTLTHLLVVPSSFVAAGTTIVAAFLVALVCAAVAVGRPRDVNARAGAWGAPASADDPIVPARRGVLPLSPVELFRRIAAKRRAAARLHLVEPLGGLLVVLLAVALVVALAWSWVAYGFGVPLWGVLDADNDLVRSILSLALPVLAWIGVALVVLFAAGAGSHGERPLGIVWDIVCYLPRTGHPFGPPSYAERAVPEIAGRLFDWLDGRPERRAVLVAHSMGGVLAVSALGVLASSSDTRPVLPRVSLLTFGVQLRAFFGRMLPELLGPQVLGTRPCLRPRVWARDPWAADAANPASAPKAVRGATLGGTLLVEASPVPWLSLWRATDYLGFPASAALPNAIDRYAEELDTSGYMLEVGTHGEYYRVPAYDAALRALARLP